VSARLDFLGRGPFRRQDPDYVPWICLDFLGFSRQYRVLSMGYAGKTTKIFLLAFSLASAAPLGGACHFSKGKRRITHEPSLPRFLIFCNRLSPAPVSSPAASTQKIRDLAPGEFSSRFAVETRQDRPSLH
jgi:hypothetical protein